MSIENVPIELPDKEVKTLLSQYTTGTGKTYYPGIKHENKYFTFGTRVYINVLNYYNIFQDTYTDLADIYVYDMIRNLQTTQLYQITTIQTQRILPHQQTMIRQQLQTMKKKYYHEA